MALDLFNLVTYNYYIYFYIVNLDKEATPMKEVSLAVFVAAICISLFSCTPIPVAIPLFPDEPLHTEELQFLKPGETTITEIREHLGEPLAIRNNSRLLLYKKSRDSWFVWFGTSFLNLEYVTFLFIEMNEANILSRYDIIRNKDGLFRKTHDCTSWNLCLDIEALAQLPKEAFADDATYILLAPQDKQPELKQPPDGQCQIIIFLDDESNFGVLRINIDENPRRSISKKGFLENIIRPGNHTITANWPHSFDEDSAEQLNISCNSEESLFVKVYTSGLAIIRPLKINVKIESIDEALKILKERRLIIN